MHEKRSSLADLAAYRELTPEQRREFVERVPGAQRLLAVYERQDKLLATLPQPQIRPATTERIWAATAGAAETQHPPLVWRRALPVLVALFLVAMLGMTGYVAAQSLPGDGLYSLKRAGEQVRLAITTREPSRLAYERLLHERRRVEIGALLAQGRQGVVVELAGFLRHGADGVWTVAGIPVILPEGVLPAPNTEVLIDGWTAEGRVRIRSLRSRVTPEPTPYAGPTPAPETSPTYAPETGTPRVAPTATPAGTGEPQHGQRGSTAVPTTENRMPTVAPTGRTRTGAVTPPVATAQPVPAASSPTSSSPQRLGQTETAGSGATVAPPTPAPQRATSAPQQQRPTVVKQAEPATTPETHGERSPSPGTGGAGQSEGGKH